MAIRSARVRLLGAPEGKVGDPFQAAARDMPTNGTIDPQRRGSQASPQRPLTRSDVLSSGEVSELLGIPCSTVHYLARRDELPHAELAAVGCSSATASPPLSRRSTSPAPGVPATITSGATTAVRGSGSP